MRIKTSEKQSRKIIKTEDNGNPAKDQWFPSQCYKCFKFTQ